MSQTSPPVAPQVEESSGYRGRHPIAAFFHIVFKAVAIIVFLLSVLGIVTSFIAMFITVTLMLAADFWVVKNVSGRLMVGLRWWNEIKEDGTNHWVFECSLDAERVHAFDASYFWITTYGNVVVWGVFTFFSITSFSKLPLCILALALGLANAFGYTKCRKDAKKKISNFLMSQAAANPGLAMKVARGGA